MENPLAEPFGDQKLSPYLLSLRVSCYSIKLFIPEFEVGPLLWSSRYTLLPIRNDYLLPGLPQYLVLPLFLHKIVISR